MQVLTWNLDGLGTGRIDERTEAAVFLAVTGRTLRQIGKSMKPTTHGPDVLLLQEVTDHTYRVHLRVHLPRAGYEMHIARPPEREPFEVVAVRKPARIVHSSTTPLASSLLGRELHVVDVDDVPGMGGPVRVLTAHFDNGPHEGEVRVDQLMQVAGAMDERSVFGGDANLRDVEWQQVAGRVDISDAWLDLGAPAATSTTWRLGERTARFDRVFVGAGLQAVSMKAVGAAKLSPTIGPPSDHIGLRVELVPAAP